MSPAASAWDSDHELIQTLVSNLPDASYLKDRRGRILAANPAMARMMGTADAAGLIGKTDFDFYPRALAAKFRKDEQALLRSGRPLLNIDEPRPNPDGSTQHILTTKVPLRDGAGKVIGLVGVSRDISDRRRTEEQYRSLFQNMREGYAHCQMLYKGGRPVDFVYLEVNKSFEELTGLKNVVGRRVTEVIPGIAKSNPELLEVYSRVAQTGRPEKFETYLDPLKIWFGVSVHSPAAGQFVAVFENLTERKRTEAALRDSEQSFRSLFENATLGLYRTTPAGRILMANPALLQMLGYDSLDELAARNLEKGGYEPGYSRAEFKTRIEESGIVRGLESAWKRRDGTTIFVRESARLVPDAKGKTLYYEGAVEDVTERLEAERSLAAEKSLLRTIIESLPDNVFFKDTAGRIILDNAAHRRLLGRETQEEVRGKTDRDFFAPELADAYERDERVIIESGRPLLNHEERTIDAQGRERWLLTNKVPVRDPRGAVTGVVGINTDITERKEAEDALRLNEQKFRTVFDGSADAIFILGRDGRFFKVNAAFCRMLGYPEEELSRLTFLDITHPDHRQVDKKNVEDLWAGRIAQYRTYKRYLTKAGDICWASLSATKLQGNEDAPQLTLAMIEDITERKRAEDELQQLALRQEAVLAAVPDIIMEVDPNKVYTWANDAGYEFFGPDVIGKEAANYFEGAQDTYAQVEPLFTGGADVFYIESWQIRRDGERRLLGWWCKTLRDGRGRVTGVLSSARDITPQKDAELALRRSEQKFRDLVENINDVIYTTTLEGNILYVSPVVRRVLGYEPEEMVGHNFLPLVAPDDRPAIQQALANILKGQFRPSDYRFLKKDGSLCWVRTSSRKVLNEATGEEVISGVMVDITERKRTDEDLRASEDKFRYIFDNSPIGKSITLPSGELSVNQAFCRMLGYDEEELQHRNWREITHPEDIDISQDKVDELLAGKAQSFRIIKRYLSKTGQTVWADVSTFLRRDEEGRPLYFMTSVLDITERKRAEDSLRASEARLSGIIENLQDAYFQADPMGRFILVSPSAARMYGYDSAESLVGLSAEMLYGDPQDRETMLVRLRESGRISDYVGRGRKRDGTDFWVSMNVQLLRDEAGRVVGTEGMVRDISERRRAEEELERHRQHLEELVQERTAQLETARLSLERVLHAAGEGIFGIDTGGLITFINEAGSRMLGWTAKDIIGRAAHETFHVEGADGTGGGGDCPSLVTARTGVSHSASDAVFRRKDGGLISVEYLSSPLGEKAAPSGAVIVFHDVTDRKRGEEERQRHMEELEKFNRAMVDREKRIIEMKEEVNHLYQELGREPKYPPVWK